MKKASGAPPTAAALKTILVVEDEVFIRMMIAETLMDAGFNVMQAANADDALKVLQSGADVDLLTTDVRMPGSIDGLQLVTRVRSEWCHIRILVISGHMTAAAGVDDTVGSLQKPFNPDDLLQHVGRLLADAAPAQV